jgi:hypothetical protein
MLRWTGRILLITLLLIHLAILVLWWDSWRTIRVPVFPASTQQFGIWSGKGMVIFANRGPDATALPLPQIFRSVVDLLNSDRYRERDLYLDPFSFQQSPGPFAAGWVDIPETTKSRPIPVMTPGFSYFRICFPYWSAAAVSGAVVWPWLGFVVFRHRRKRRRQRVGLCPKCGYDIRANPARCSECGQAPAETVGPA